MSAAAGRVASSEKSFISATMREIAGGRFSVGMDASAEERVAQTRRREIT
jgi:hypothetical protein